MRGCNHPRTNCSFGTIVLNADHLLKIVTLSDSRSIKYYIIYVLKFSSVQVSLTNNKPVHRHSCDKEISSNKLRFSSCEQCHNTTHSPVLARSPTHISHDTSGFHVLCHTFVGISFVECKNWQARFASGRGPWLPGHVVDGMTIPRNDNRRCRLAWRPILAWSNINGSEYRYCDWFEVWFGVFKCRNVLKRKLSDCNGSPVILQTLFFLFSMKMCYLTFLSCDGYFITGESPSSWCFSSQAMLHLDQFIAFCGRRGPSAICDENWKLLYYSLYSD